MSWAFIDLFQGVALGYREEDGPRTVAAVAAVIAVGHVAAVDVPVCIYTHCDGCKRYVRAGVLVWGVIRGRSLCVLNNLVWSMSTGRGDGS